MLHLVGGLLWRHVLSDMLFESHRNMGAEDAPRIFRPILPEIGLRCALSSLICADVACAKLLCF